MIELYSLSDDRSLLVHAIAALDRCHRLFAQWCKACLFELIAVEHIVGIEGYQAFRIGMCDVNAGLLDGAQVEALRIDELHDQDAEEVLISERCGCDDLRQAA